MRRLVIFKICLAICLAASGGACSLNDFVFGRLAESSAGLFTQWHGQSMRGSELTRLSDRLYTYRWEWYRSLVVRTGAGYVVIDPFNPVAAADLRERLAAEERSRRGQRAGAEPRIHTLIYSHYHIDHVSGGRELAPANVLAHKLSPGYWSYLSNTADVLAPTRLIDGDHSFRVGGVEFRLIDLGRSHTDTMFALHVPSERALFLADIGIIRTMPADLDVFLPGVIQGMEKLAGLDFEIYVPSHYGYGTKQDFLDALEYLSFVRALAREGVAKHNAGAGRSLPLEGERMRALFDSVYYPTKAKYGHWHGFSELAFANLFRRIVGETLGF
ncbi:MAG: MBL fold metallo-hydrolase [Leptospirales bacterium]|jgi:glyoxylase-like metal-dependent hydrolase (beta-lactamase superfamily II)